MHYDVQISANRVVDTSTLDTILAIMRQATKPLLIHCQAGADRSGLIAGVYLFRIEGQPASTASRQLSLLYGHFLPPGRALYAQGFWTSNPSGFAVRFLHFPCQARQLSCSAARSGATWRMTSGASPSVSSVGCSPRALACVSASCSAARRCSRAGSDSGACSSPTCHHRLTSSTGTARFCQGEWPDVLGQQPALGVLWQQHRVTTGDEQPRRRSEEKAHHYLWRFWRHLPRAGRVTIYDRSWCGRVLVERVEGFASEDEWMRAYKEINDFEQPLAEHGIVVLPCATSRKSGSVDNQVR